LSSANLKAAEASLTGESEAVLKQSAPLRGQVALGDRTNMVYKGTAVAQGIGRAVVTATGMSTEMGHIAGLLERTDAEPTPLEREIDRVGRTLRLAAIGIAVVVVQRRRRRPALARFLGTSDTEFEGCDADELFLGARRKAPPSRPC
jgi:P-type Ca2+ transporter type 2C